MVPNRTVNPKYTCSDAEIRYFDIALFVDQQIIRFDVSMDEPDGM